MIMNTNAVYSELEEAVGHLTSLAKKIKTDVDFNDEEDLALSLAHVLNHLCCAWHFRLLDEKAIENLHQDVFNQLSQALPNFDGELILLNGRDVLF